MSKFDELKKLAEAASPGPWKGDRYDGTVKYELLDANDNTVIRGDNGNSDAGPFGITGEDDEKFILAANPAAVLELLAIKAQLVEALKGLDDSFCSINEFSTKEERHQARMNLIAARAAIAASGAQP